MPQPRTRLAPSPTGALHLGNARTFFLNWLLARQNGWSITLRIEDLDGPRIKAGADRQALDDLCWLGLDWDHGPVLQSRRMGCYRDAVDRLIADGQVYPCVCSRTEIDRAGSAPHAEDGAAIYPGTCRGRFGSIEEAAHLNGRPPCLRFDTSRQPPVSFDDLYRGPITTDVARELGDFVVAKSDGTPAYQLAVVVDDAAMGITHVVRGDDLLDSTPRQILLYHALGQADRIPRYTHLPLVVGPDGRRLAKRHGDTRLSSYRSSGVTPGAILRLLAKWSGMDGDGNTPADYVGRFDLARLPREPIVFSAQEEASLGAEGGGS